MKGKRRSDNPQFKAKVAINLETGMDVGGRNQEFSVSKVEHGDKFVG
jgi:hypothetical protein